MYGVSKISSEQNIMLITFPNVPYSTASLAKHLKAFADIGVVVDMISQSAQHGDKTDYSFTTSFHNFATVMQGLNAAQEKNAQAPRIGGGYSKINLYGAEMVTQCGVAARALTALAKAEIEVALITTSDLDISLLVPAGDEDAALDALSAAFSL